MTSKSLCAHACATTRGARAKYDRPLGVATPKAVTDRTLARFPVVLPVVALGDLPGRLWQWYVLALLVIGALSAWLGHRAATRAMIGAPSPTLTALRARVGFLRGLVDRFQAPSAYERHVAREQLRAADRDLERLSLPPGYHPRRSTRPLTDRERPLGAVVDERPDA